MPEESKNGWEAQQLRRTHQETGLTTSVLSIAMIPAERGKGKQAPTPWINS